MRSDVERRVDRIWSRYQRSRSPVLRNALMEHYLPFVRQCAERIHARLPSSVQLEDLVSSGVFGLAEAIAAYKVDRHVRFTTFSARRISGAILDELRATDWVPRQVRISARKVAAATMKLEQELGRPPADEEVAGRLNIPAHRFAKLEKESRGAALFSLDVPMSDSTTESGRGALQIPDPRSMDPARHAHRRSIGDLLKKGLTHAERLIVLLYYYEGMKMAEIGATLDLSESRVSQIHASVLVRLKSNVGIAMALQDAAA